ncbi:MAG: LVIVD repeat-containing protein [Nannocystales bacterium]
MLRNRLNPFPNPNLLLGQLLIAAPLATSLAACGDDEATAGMGETDGETSGGAAETGTGDPTAASGSVSGSTAGGTTDGTTSGTGGETTTSGSGADDTTSTGGADDTTSGGDESTTGGDTDGTGGEPDWVVEVEHAGGQPRDMQVEGSIAFAAQGPRLTLWDLSDPSNVTKLGETDPFVGVVNAVAVQGELAYVVEYQDLDGRLHVVDVSDPSAPSVVDTITYTASAYRRPEDVAIDGDRLFLSDTEAGVFEFDLTDPTAPVVLNQLGEFGIYHIQPVGDRLYFALGGFIGTSVGALDRTNALAFLGLSSVSTPIGMEFTQDDQLVTSGGFGTTLYDVSEINLPTSLFTDKTYSREVAVDGSRGFLPHEDGLSMLDWSDTDAVTMSAVVPLPTGRTTAAGVGSGELVLMTELGRLLAIDVSGDASVDDELETPGCVDCTDAVVSGEHVLVADFYFGGRILDAATLEVIGRMEVPGDQPGVEGVAVSGDYAYLADWSSGLHVYDISNPSVPAHAGFVSTGGFPSAVAVAGDYAYVAESTNGGALRVVDISDPTSPQLVSTLATSQTFDIEIHGDLAFLADGSTFGVGGMRIVDISDPNTPTIIGHYTHPDCSHASGVAIEQGTAIVACSSSFHVVDVDDPTAPTLLSTFENGEIYLTHDAAIDGDRAYLGHGYGLDIVDISDPSMPQLVSFEPTAYPVRSVDLTKSHTVAVSTALGGVYHWELE